MLSLLRRKPKVEVEALAPVIDVEALEEAEAAVGAKQEPEPEPVRRWKQQNIKASEDCCATFAALAKAQSLTKSELFEDMVVARLEELQRQGVRVE